MELESRNRQLDSILLEDASVESRAEFYKKTYAHLAGAFLLFIVFEVILLSIPAVREIGIKMTQGYVWLMVLGGFMLATNAAHRWALNSHDRQKQYAGLVLYALAEAIIFVPLLMVALSFIGGGELLMQALVTTLFLFGGLSAVVLTTKKDFSFLRSIITVGGIVAMGAIVAGIAFGFDLGLWFSFGMVGLAAASILYDTSNMVHKYDTSQYVAASLGLFASFMLMLWYVIRIFLSRD